MEADEEDR